MIELQHIEKSYQRGDNKLRVLNDINLHIEQNEFVAITGPSGSGKSTLMSILGCLDVADKGEYLLLGNSITRASEFELARIRNQYIGFVFQMYNLIPRLTALRNVELPLVYAGIPEDERTERARNVLQMLGLGERGGHTPAQLSGGQQQRVAIARALVNNPPLIIADEPTGSLDSHAAQDVMHLFKQLHQHGKTIILVTHDLNLIKYAKRNVHLVDGRIVKDQPI